MANNRYTNIDLSRYRNGYQPSTTVNDALRRKQEAENAVSNYGNFNYSNQSAYQSVINDILNRKDFSYDMNADALYQQYKNQYQALGELAMQDTVGQVSALTGGYGNSYAATAGSQAYQSYLNQLNDKIPELWSLARSAYESDRAADYDKYGMLSADRQTQYGEWTDGLNRLLNERGYYADNYNNAYNREYSQWVDNRNYDQSQYWNEYNAGYQAERDAIADAQWEKSFNASRSGGGSGNYNDTVGYTGKVESSFKQTTGSNRFKNNGELFTRSEYDTFKYQVAMSRTKEGVAALIEDAYLEGKITETQANEFLANHGISDEDFKKYRGIE